MAINTLRMAVELSGFHVITEACVYSRDTILFVHTGFAITLPECLFANINEAAETRHRNPCKPGYGQA